jgi:hypothetical protein
VAFFLSVSHDALKNELSVHYDGVLCNTSNSQYIYSLAGIYLWEASTRLLAPSTANFASRAKPSNMCTWPPGAPFS